MAEKLRTIERPPVFDPRKPTFPNDQMTLNPTLDIFIGPRSWLIFSKLKAIGEQLDDEVEH